MPKPLSQVPRYRAGQPALSAANKNARLDAIRRLISGFTVSAPLSAVKSPGAIHITASARALGIIEAHKGDMLQHLESQWDIIEAPDQLSILFFDATVGLADWIPAQGTCA